MSNSPATTDTIRGAVAKRQDAPAQVNAATVIRQAIERQTPALRSVLPRDHDPERFARLVLTAVKSTDKLMQCFATPQGEVSVLLAAMQIATVGLEPNTALQEAWLLPRRVKQPDGSYIWECQPSYGYRGLLKLARRSGEIKSVFAGVVRDGDHFVWGRGVDVDKLEHVEAPDAERGELSHAYAVVRYLNGGSDFVVLSQAQVEARRAASDSWKNEKSRPYSPWAVWPEDMWKKTALRVLSKTMPMSAEVARVTESDESPLKLDDGIILAQLADDDERPALEAGE